MKESRHWNELGDYNHTVFEEKPLSMTETLYIFQNVL